MNTTKKIFLLTSAFCLSLSVMAQQSRDDIRKDVSLSGSNYTAYYGPQKQLSAAPAGYTPYYISHYGRHGSRYLIGTRDYDKAYNILLKADSANALTPKGKETMEKLRLIRDEAKGRDGELTQRGAEQHKGIAKRMYERFPEVFKGNVTVDAKSTVVIRCILSMENALQQLLLMNPALNVKHDASEHDMYYMNFNDRKLNSQKMPKLAHEKYDAFYSAHSHPDRVMAELFSSEDYVKTNVKANELMDMLWKLASNVQSTELRHHLSLYDLFNEDEVYDQWQKQNAWWYINYAASPLNGAQQPLVQRNLLRKIISEADSCLQLPHPGATLRYGHEVIVMPLVALLDLNGYGAQIEDLEQLDDKGWLNYRIYPMGCNVQFIFYHKNDNDRDPVFKVLLNEDEATLPIKAWKGCYYKWSDFREYFLKKLDSYK